MNVLSLLMLLGLWVGVSEPQAKLTLAFLGVNGAEEPLLVQELERQIQQELRSLKDFQLKPKDEVRQLFEKGILKSPEVGPKRTSIIAKKLDTRILTFAKLGRLDMDYSRKWYSPWKGSLNFSHSIWYKIIDSHDGSVKFSGQLEAFSRVENKFLGWQPTLGKVDPLLRNQQMLELINSIAVEAREMLVASMKGVEEIISEKKKSYDPSFFENMRQERTKKETQGLKSSGKLRPIIERDAGSLFKKQLTPEERAAERKAKEAAEAAKNDLSDYELKDQEIEIIEEDESLMEDVNLMEGM